MNAGTVLTIEQLSKNYGKIHALNGLSIGVGKGSIFGLLGPNGSGKTTTLSIILDLIKANQGNYRWFGEVPSKESRKRIGAVIESPNFFPYMSAEKNLQVVALVKDLPYDDIPRVLRLTGLYERRQSHFRTFSFGMKQRLAVASALLGNPEVLILDEPTNGLDPQGIAQIRELILEVAAGGTTIILASHLLDEVQKICTHVAVLSKGVVLYTGNVSDVLAVSDCIEIGSENNDLLEKAIASHEKFKSLIRTETTCLVYFSGLADPGEINSFLFSKGIILTHLSERKRSLEKHFLQLLQDNQ